ncbi:hypothetical protein T439DRAFT_384426 [Meredithblackwellia eburnea MCA 4105]
MPQRFNMSHSSAFPLNSPALSSPLRPGIRPRPFRRHSLLSLEPLTSESDPSQFNPRSRAAQGRRLSEASSRDRPWPKMNKELQDTVKTCILELLESFPMTRESPVFKSKGVFHRSWNTERAKTRIWYRSWEQQHGAFVVTLTLVPKDGSEADATACALEVINQIVSRTLYNECLIHPKKETKEYVEEFGQPRFIFKPGCVKKYDNLSSEESYYLVNFIFEHPVAEDEITKKLVLLKGIPSTTTRSIESQRGLPFQSLSPEDESKKLKEFHQIETMTMDAEIVFALPKTAQY